MDKKDFSYDLPKHLIAQQPLARRDGSRLMLLNRATGAVQHALFTDIVAQLRPGDCIVLNDSRVIPARLMGHSGQAKIEMLLHERLEENRWSVLTKPGRKAQVGDVLTFGEGRLTATVEEIIEDGLRVVTLSHEGPFEPLLEEIGEMPLPHYIEEKQEDTARYQTVYATHDGSVAAPTAGLHFTEETLAQIQAAGVNIARVTLHVGIGTFRPVTADKITDHTMHSEYCRVSEETAALLNQTRQNGGRIIAIGTTSCRTLESRVTENGEILPGAGKTDIFIYPGFTFRAIDGLLTNFHLPESTLIMLVSALAGRDAVLAAYRQAVEEEYRFFSYGDAMLIL